MIKTIEEYNENKEEILKQVGDDVMSPHAIADIIDVPIIDIRALEEITSLKEFKELENSDSVEIFENFADSFEVGMGTAFDEMFNYGASNLVFIFYWMPKMNYFFVMDNGKFFRVKHGELMAGKRARIITERLLLVFESFKIEDLKDRSTWIPINSRFEILDL